MKEKILLISLFLLSLIFSAQSCEDSVTIPDIQWECKNISEGIQLRSAKTNLFNSQQAVYIVDIDTNQANINFWVGVSDTLLATNVIARKKEALLAINGTYFNRTEGYSRHFIKLDSKVISSTEEREFDTRATGVFTISGGHVDISDWNIEKEQNVAGNVQYALVCGPLMIDNSSDITMWDNVFVTTRHPRSFVAMTDDGHILFVAVDGKQPGYADGMSLYELRSFARSIGCVDALNLDGGGSTTLYIEGEANNGIINTPSDPEERPVASILYVTDDN